ncbi:MAG: flagellar hook-length control protein FliK [Planctomycetota bacterium]
MISLLPPSPVPSQIDTKFLRSESAHLHHSDDAKFHVPDVPEPEPQPRKAEEPVAEDEPENDGTHDCHRAKAEDSQPQESVDTLLQLISQQSPKKKPTALEALAAVVNTKSEADRPHDTLVTDVPAVASIQQSAAVLTPAALTPAALTPAATPAETISRSAVAQVAAGLKKTPDADREKTASLLGAAVEDVPDDLVPASAVAPIPKAAAVGAGVASTAETLSVPLPESVPSDIMMEVVSHTSNRSDAVSLPVEDLKTTFEKPAVQLFAPGAERDELTRQIEQMIARTASGASAATASTESATGLTMTAESGSRDPSVLPVPDNALTIGSTAAMAEQQADPASAMLISGSAGNRDQRGSAFTQTANDGGSIVTRTDSGGSIQSTTQTWSQGSALNPDLSSSIRSEIREPLSSQAARAILNHLETRRSDEAKTLTVRLDPPELGEMTIELSKTREGLSVRVTARESVTLDMLLARGQEIEQHLKSQQVDVTSMEFFSSGASGQQTPQRNSDSGYQNAAESSPSRRSSASQTGRSGTKRTSPGTRESEQSLSFRA